MSQLPSLAPIVKALDFIEEMLTSPVGVADIADAVAYSLYHFCRVFNRATHHTPYDYLMRRRLAQAARELHDSDRNVIDIALDLQFNSAEAFSRAFKRVHGVQPSVYRKGGRIDHRGLMPRLTLDHLILIRDGRLSKPAIMRRDAISLVGIMVQIEQDGTADGALWDLLTEELAEVEGWRHDGDAFGITWYPRNWQNRGLLYLAAVQLPNADVGGAPLIIKHIPAQHYARFVYRGACDRLALVLEYIYHTWLPRSGCSLGLPMVVERLGARWLEGIDSEQEIWIPIASTPRSCGSPLKQV